MWRARTRLDLRGLARLAGRRLILVIGVVLVGSLVAIALIYRSQSCDPMSWRISGETNDPAACQRLWYFYKAIVPEM